MKAMYILIFSLLLYFSACAQVFTNMKHMVVIGVDGMSPNGIDKANTPNLDILIKSGAHSFKAQSVLPSSSSPNWASMIMGASPAEHGITSNDWERTDLKKKLIAEVRREKPFQPYSK